MSLVESPYQTLGVSGDASQEAIHGAYRALVKECHPDTHPGNAMAEGRFRAMSDAKDLLSDPERRELYDRSGVAEMPRSMVECPSMITARLARKRRKTALDTAMITASAVIGAIGIFRCVF